MLPTGWRTANNAFQLVNRDWFLIHGKNKQISGYFFIRAHRVVSDDNVSLGSTRDSSPIHAKNIIAKCARFFPRQFVDPFGHDL